jgi:hypothetical protein
LNPGFEGEQSVEHGGINVLVLVNGAPCLCRRHTSEVNVTLTQSGSAPRTLVYKWWPIACWCNQAK